MTCNTNPNPPRGQCSSEPILEQGSSPLQASSSRAQAPFKPPRAGLKPPPGASRRGLKKISHRHFTNKNVKIDSHFTNPPRGQCSSRTMLLEDNAPRGQCSSRTMLRRIPPAEIFSKISPGRLIFFLRCIMREYSKTMWHLAPGTWHLAPGTCTGLIDRHKVRPVSTRGT
jgi:hypothetical protein